MNKIKLFISNFMVYGLGGIISKIIPVIMLPVITRLMPDTYYFGLNDLSTTLISFGQAFAVMGMYDAMYRMFFEKGDDADKMRVCSTALIFTAITSSILFVFLLIFQRPLSQLLFSDRKYGHLLFLSGLSILIGSTNSIVAAPTRMQNKRTAYILVNSISSAASYSIAIPLLLKGYFVVALPVASTIAAFSSEAVYLCLNRKWFSIKWFSMQKFKQMLAVALPLMPNFLVYWIFNYSDRLMIAKFLGNDAVGIYAIGAKLGLCSQLIYTAFAGGWQYFAFKTMKEANQVRTNSLVFEYLGLISFATTAFIMALSQLIYQLFFDGNYVDGYVVSGYLFMAPLLQMLYQVAVNQLLVIKKTWPSALILLSGAVLNIVMNLLLIPMIGIEGAAIATLLGYAMTDLLCCVVLKRMRLLEISVRFIISTLVMILYIVTWRFLLREQWITATILACSVSAALVFIYRADISKLINAVKK